MHGDGLTRCASRLSAGTTVPIGGRTRMAQHASAECAPGKGATLSRRERVVGCWRSWSPASLLARVEVREANLGLFVILENRTRHRAIGLWEGHGFSRAANQMGWRGL
jgi:hypothetical protein